MTLTDLLIQSRRTFDEERQQPFPCRCGRLVTGRHPCQEGAPCPFARPPVTGRWGIIWSELDG